MASAQTNYEYLWDGSQGSWLLVDVGHNARIEDLIVVNAVTKVALIIEDDGIAKAVVQKMLDAGVTVKTAGEVF